MGAIFAAVGSAIGAGQAAAGIFSGLHGMHPKDAERIATAQSKLTAALAGDSSALAWIIGQAANSATAVGQEAYRRALSYYNQQAGTSYTPGAVAPASISPVQQIIQNTTQNVQRDIAGGAQALLTGASNKLGATTGTYSFPFSPTQLLIGGGVLLAALYGLKHQRA